jgi:hypothetical protein
MDTKRAFTADTTSVLSADATSAHAEGGKLRVFISYSRDDLDFADQLDISLRLLGFETSLELGAIGGGLSGHS